MKITKKHIENVISGKSKVRNGDAIEAASNYLKRSENTFQKIQQQKHFKQQEADLLGVYITKNKLWVNIPSDVKYLAEGAEQKVFFLDGKHICKVNDTIFYSSWEDYFHNLLLHNYFFPDTAYELMGFTKKDDTLYAVVKQPFVDRTCETDLESVKNIMADNGFINTKNNDYYNPELGLILEDLHDENVLTKNGILYFIDTVFYLQENKYMATEILADGGTISEQVEEKLIKQQANKEFKDIGRVAQTRKEKSAYKLISGSLLSDLEQDGVMAYNMVKKENVWPEINIQEEKDRGTSSGATYLKVKIREAAPTRPKDDKGKRATYVLFLELLQKDLIACFTVKQIKDLIEKYRSMPMESIIGYFINPDFLKADEPTKELIKEQLKTNKNFTLASIYGGSYLAAKLINEVFGAKFENIIFNKSDSSRIVWAEAGSKESISPEESEKLIQLLRERKQRFVEANQESIKKYREKTIPELLSAMGTDWTLQSESMKRYKADPESFRQWAISYYERRIKQEESVWETKEKSLLPKADDWSWTESVAKTEASKPKSEAINTKAPLSYIKRTGGHKVEANTPVEIIEKFGFSAVNYGVYVDDKWSKEHTKHFLGAMSDLAELIDVDIKSFNQLGKLSIAFGAKGRKGHMATYFPQTKDINLTRGNGDGSLAHEWGHYFDNVIVEKADRLAVNAFASQGASPDYEIKLLYKELMDFFFRGLPGITPKVPMRFYAKEAKEAPSYSARIDGNYVTKSVEIKSTIEETLEQLDAFARVDKDIYNTQLRLFGYVIAQFGLESYNIPSKLKTSYFFHKSAYGVFQYCYKTDKGINIAVIPRTKYWIDPVELFARAWETVILKKLIDKGRMSNYLVNDIPMEDIISESYSRPYPTGAELGHIEKIMDRIVLAVKEKYSIAGFMPTSEIIEDEYLDLSDNGKVAAGIVIEEDIVTGEETVDFVGAIATLELLLEAGGSEEETAEWKEAIETLKMLE